MNQASRGRSSHRTWPRAAGEGSVAALPGESLYSRITFLSVLPPLPSFHLSLPHSFLLQRHCSRPNCLHGPESLKATLFCGTDSPWSQEAVYIVVSCKSKSKMKKQNGGCEQKVPGRAFLPPPSPPTCGQRMERRRQTISRFSILDSPEALSRGGGGIWGREGPYAMACWGILLQTGPSKYSHLCP